MNAPTSGQRPARRQLGVWAWCAIAVVVVLVAGLGVLGAWVSFSSVEEAVTPSFGDRAWAVPIGVDVGIAVLTALDLLMTWLDMRIRWLRPVVWVLVTVTTYLNVAAETTLIGQVAHGVLPSLWVIAVEAASHALRTWAGLGRAKGSVRIDRLRWSRWLLAPWPTLRLWRRMRLLEIPTLTEALARDLDYDLARAALQDTYKPLVWRWKAPRRERVLYRHGALTPAHLGVELDDVRGPSSSRGGAPAGRATAPRRRQAPPTTKARSNGRNGRRSEVELPAELVEVGRRVARQLQAEGRRLTRDELVTRIRAEGRSCPNDKAGALLAQLQAELAGAQP